jgi:hypothetical protein
VPAAVGVVDRAARVEQADLDVKRGGRGSPGDEGIAAGAEPARRLLQLFEVVGVLAS